MREVYVAAHVHDGTRWHEVAAPAVLPPANVRAPSKIGSAAPRTWRGAGNGFAAYPKLAQDVDLADIDPFVCPTAQDVGLLALPRLAAGEGVSSGAALPFYVRHRVALTTAERGAELRL